MANSRIPSFNFKLDASSSQATHRESGVTRDDSRHHQEAAPHPQPAGARERVEEDVRMKDAATGPARTPAMKRDVSPHPPPTPPARARPRRSQGTDELECTLQRDPHELIDDPPGFRSTRQPRPSSCLPDFTGQVWHRPSFLPPSPEDSPPLYRERKKEGFFDIDITESDGEDGAGRNAPSPFSSAGDSDEDPDEDSWFTKLILDSTGDVPKAGVDVPLFADGFDLELEAERLIEEEQAAPLFEQLAALALDGDDDGVEANLQKVMEQWATEPVPDMQVAALPDIQIEPLAEQQPKPALKTQQEKEEEAKVIEEQWKQEEKGANPKYLAPPNVALTAHGDIPVQHEPETAEAFFPNTPIDDATRLSPGWLKALKKPNVILAAAPTGFHTKPAPPLEVKKARARMVTSQVVRSTLHSYASEVIEYLEWCERRNIPANERFPTQQENIVAFLSEFGGLYRASTIMRRLSAITFWHSAHSLHFEFPANMRHSLTRSLRNLQPPANPPVPPVTVEDILTIIISLEEEARARPSRAGMCAAVQAAVLSLFWGMSRVIELLVETFKPREDETGGFSPATNPSGADLTIHEATSRFPRTATILLPHTKTKQFDGASIVLTTQTAVNDNLDPIIHLAHHRVVNQPQPHEHLFTYTCDDGSRRPLTGSWVVNRANQALEEAGRVKISGRSFRCGGATAYILAGKDAEAVKGMGNWLSHAFHLYFRRKREMAACVLANADVPFEELPVEITEDNLEREIEKLRHELEVRRKEEKKEKQRKEKKKKMGKGKKKEAASDSESDLDLGPDDEPVSIEDLFPPARTTRAKRQAKEHEHESEDEEPEYEEPLDDPEWPPGME